MARRQTSRRPLRLPSLGDMREVIDLIESRSLGGLNIADPYATQHIEVAEQVFAKVEDITNRREFDNVSLDDRPTHRFTIRFNANVNAESTLRHLGDYYRVIDVSHLDERREFMRLNCKLRGDVTQAAAR